MQIYLPIAELPLDVFAILLLGATAGFLAGMFGIGGGFLIVPGLMAASGMPMFSAVGSSLFAVSAFGATTAARYFAASAASTALRSSSLSGATWAPAYIAYGNNNRTACVRIPYGRIEMRLPDGVVAGNVRSQEVPFRRAFSTACMICCRESVSCSA